MPPGLRACMGAYAGAGSIHKNSKILEHVCEDGDIILFLHQSVELDQNQWENYLHYINLEQKNDSEKQARRR